MNKEAKILFFFTSSYPFNKGETFIENEIKYLSSIFDKIIIISNDLTSKQTRDIPKNVILYRLSYELSKYNKFLSVKNVFNSVFWEELKIIKKTYNKKITISIINTLFQTLQKSKIVEKLITSLINKYNINSKIYLYSYWTNDMAFAIARYGNKNKEIVSFSRMHGWDTYFEVNKINYLPYRKYIFFNLNRIFAISQKGKNYYKDLFPNLQNKISVSYLGTKFIGLNNINNPHKFTILTISNLIPIKNLSALIKALNIINIDFKWIHIGSGPLFDELNEKAKQLIPNKYEFKGYMQNKEVLNFLKITPVDLFVNVSKSEGIPVSIMEVMSFGIPCMATAVGGMPEIVNNENGVLLSANPTSMYIAKKIEDYHNLPKSEIIKKRNNSYETWKNKFNADKNYNKFINQILKL